MTEEEQRIAIAKFCGWTFPQEPGFELYWVIRPNGVEASPGPVELSTIGRRIPDYLRDLNAIHEAELKLDDGQAMEFERCLRRVCMGKNYRCVISATAAQRAEALLKTIGK